MRFDVTITGAQIAIECANRRIAVFDKIGGILNGPSPHVDSQYWLCIQFSTEMYELICAKLIGFDGFPGKVSAARALVLPSFAEGLPVVVMETMALRRPVLTTYVAGIPELVRPGENGWLFPAGSVEALAEAMADCLAQPPELLATMGEAARQRVLARHDIDTEAAKLARLFQTGKAA